MWTNLLAAINVSYIIIQYNVYSQCLKTTWLSLKTTCEIINTSN